MPGPGPECARSPGRGGGVVAIAREISLSPMKVLGRKQSQAGSQVGMRVGYPMGYGLGCPRK